jgi:hypothetical protein
LNDLLLKSLPDLLLNPIKRRYDTSHELLKLSYKDLKRQIFNVSARLEFGSDLVTYLEDNAQPPEQPLATYHAFLEGMNKAYPQELSSMSVPFLYLFPHARSGRPSHVLACPRACLLTLTYASWVPLSPTWGGGVALPALLGLSGGRNLHVNVPTGVTVTSPFIGNERTRSREKILMAVRPRFYH